MKSIINFTGSIKAYLENEKLSFIFACICIFLIPTYTFFIPPFIILWLISRVAEIIIRYRSTGCLPSYSPRILIAALLFSTFLIAETATLIYTENLSNGLNIIFSRLSLFVFPLLFVFPGQYVVKKAKFLTGVFTAGTLLYIVFCFSYAAFRSIYIADGNIRINTHPPDAYWMSYFFGSLFSSHQHPSYVAIFAILSVMFIFESIYSSNKRIEKILLILSALLLLFSVYFLSSRAGFIIILITIPLHFFIRLRTMRRKVLLSVIFISLIISGVFIIRTNERIDIIMNSVFSGSLKDMKEKITRDNRILIWKSSLKVIKKNPIIGVGIGDVRDELIKVYKSLNDEDIISSRYNAHNQFLEVAIEGGMICLLTFMALIAYLFYLALIQRNLILFLFLITVIVFFSFETVLYRLAGVSFFSVFSFLLMHFNSEPIGSIDKSR